MVFNSFQINCNALFLFFFKFLSQSKCQRIFPDFRIRKCDRVIIITFGGAGEARCRKKWEGKTERTHAHTHTHAQTHISLCTQHRSFTYVPHLLFLRLSANYWPEGRGFTVRGWREKKRRKRERGAGEETRLPELLPETRRGWKPDWLRRSKTRQTGKKRARRPGEEAPSRMLARSAPGRRCVTVPLTAEDYV